MVDLYRILGLEPGAGPDEVARAYRDLAKRHHPDRVGGGGEVRMAQINAAYAALRNAPAAPPAPSPRRAASPGDWLAPAVRHALGPELIGALARDEPVRLVCPAAAWDSHEVVLAITDRRLLWLREDAFANRVRSLRYAEVASVQGRLKRPRRRVGELRIRPRAGGRRVGFSELRPDVLRQALALLEGYGVALSD